MKKLISLELKRNSLHSYHIAVLISTFILLGLLYFLAAIPKFDKSGIDMEILMSYDGLIGLNNILCMAVFTILSAVMSAKFIVEEYAGKKMILLFSYPVERKKILGAKLLMVFLYTVVSMILSGFVILSIFFLTESMFPVCADQISIKVIINAFFSMICIAMISGALGTLALWIGFLKKSISVTILASVIIASLSCQIMIPTIAFPPALIVFLLLTIVMAVILQKNLFYQVKKMEVLI